MNDILPGGNCGACGLAGCSDLATAIVSGYADPAACKAANAEIMKCPTGVIHKLVDQPFLG